MNVQFRIPGHKDIRAMLTRRRTIIVFLLLASYGFAYNAGANAVAHPDNKHEATQDEYIANLVGGARQFVESCTPLDTGGGVTQCANPTTFDSAIVACFDNAGPYVGRNIEDTFHLMSQCVDDFMRMKGWR